VIGGAQIYAAAIAADVVDRMVVTHVQLSPRGDAWFPSVDWTQWRETTRESHAGYDIVTYDRA
jgi:dihydrofolate reductase